MPPALNATHESSEESRVPTAGGVAPVGGANAGNPYAPPGPTADDEASAGREAGNPYAPGTLGELLWIALPLMASQGSLSLMHVTDRVLLTWYSPTALAASFPAGVLNWQIISLAVGTVGYVNTFVAQYEGAKEKHKVAAALWQAVHLAWMFGLLVLALAPLSPWIFRSIGHEPAVQDLETRYFAALTLGSGPFLGATALSAFFTGRGETLPVLLVNVVCVLFNAVVDYALIFGVGPIPAMGVTGAALATSLSNLLQFALFAYLVSRRASGPEYGFWSAWRFDFDLIKRMLRFGFPHGLHMFVEVLCFSLFTLLLGWSGEAGLAAASLTFNINSLAFIPLFGLSTAVATLVGQRLGEDEPDLRTRTDLAARTTWLALGVSMAYSAACAAVFVLAPQLVLSMYSAYSDPEEFAALHGTAVALLRFVAFYTFFDALGIIVGGALRGAGDTLWLLLWGAGTGFLTMVVPAWINHKYYGGAIEGDFAAVAVFIVILGVGTLLRFLGGKWKSMKVIE